MSSLLGSHFVLMEFVPQDLTKNCQNRGEVDICFCVSACSSPSQPAPATASRGQRGWVDEKPVQLRTLWGHMAPGCDSIHSGILYIHHTHCLGQEGPQGLGMTFRRGSYI